VQSLAKTLSTYVHIAKTSFLARSHYRFELLFDSIKAIVVVLVLTAIWRELYTERNEIAGYSLEQIVIYTCAASALALLFNVDLSHYISGKIRSGAIILDLTKPLSLSAFYLSENLGGVLYAGLFAAVPTFLALSLMFGISGDFTSVSLIAIPLVIAGFFVHYIFCHLLALTTFFTVEAWGIEYLRINLIRFFAGGFVPLAFFPESLKQLSNVLPFQYMIFPAASAISGTFPSENLVPTLLMQFGWIAVLLAADLGCWSLVSRKVTVHGG
jgi:ABC-2 type transport system permease protein